MKVKLACLFFLVASVCLAQDNLIKLRKGSKIGDFKQLGTTYVELWKDGDNALFIYRDDKYKTMDVYNSFTFPYADLDTVASLFIDFSKVSEGENKVIDATDGGTVVFYYGKTLGKMHVNVEHTDRAGVVGSVRWMTIKQATKLFYGKKKK